MTPKLHASTAMALTAVAFVAFPVTAWAQSNAPTAPADQQDNGEIVVTAQKRSENLQSVPVAVSVLSGAALAQTARPSIESAAQLVPALNFLKSGTTLNQTIFLRGVGTATFSIAGEPSVSTVVDGVVYARSGEAFSDLVDVAQMEVLRGPQGTLFGKNASAGVVNITTQMPKFEWGGTAEASYFDRNEFRLKGSVNIPLAQDLAARVTGFYGTYDGNIWNTAANNWVNGYKHWGVRGQILYEPSDDLRIYATADYHKNRDNCCAEIIGANVSASSLINSVLPTPQGADSRQIAQNLVTRTEEEGWGLSLQADMALGTNTVTSITSYRRWNNTEIRDGDFLPQAYVGFNQLHDTGPQKSTTFSQEIRLTSPAKQFISYVVGAYYSNATSRRIFTRNVLSCTAVAGAPTTVLIPCGSALANPTTSNTGTADFGSEFNNIAVFGQGTMNVSDSLRLIAGLRYTHDSLSVFEDRVSQAAGPGINASFLGFNTSTSSDNLSGKAAIQYDLSRDIMTYASYARGYKGPAYNVFFNLTGTGTNVIAPETSDAYEIGLKNTLFGGKLTLNIAGFYAKYYNFQANNPDLAAGVVVTRFTNAGKVSTRGVEVDFSLRPIRDLSLNGGVAYTDAHVDAFFQPTPTTPVIPSGTPLAYAPKWKGSLSADYRWRTGGPVDLYLGAQGNFQSSQLSIFSPTLSDRVFGTIAPYGLVNLSAGIGDSADKYRLTFQVRNLFDKSYIAAVQTGGPSGGLRYQIPRDADRYWGVTGRVNF
ncbi:MAG TPA: TonB-dependent receptor [Sphingobium sp.]|uniref:TonB-dependent receptor n=1 Tax=Sphingobium sp. TaxID=1912891 RepID=UPI002ED686AB